MKKNIISASIFLGVAFSNAQAFTSFAIDFPEGLPKSVKIEYKFSKGNCQAPLPVNCNTSEMAFDLPTNDPTIGNVVEAWVNTFSQENANSVFSDNPVEPINNYVRFSVDGGSNICQVDLKQPGAILVHLKKDGSC